MNCALYLLPISLTVLWSNPVRPGSRVRRHSDRDALNPFQGKRIARIVVGVDESETLVRIKGPYRGAVLFFPCIFCWVGHLPIFWWVFRRSEGETEKQRDSERKREEAHYSVLDVQEATPGHQG